MKSSFKKLPGSKVELEVSLDQKEFLPYYEAAYEQALSGVRLKGFRPGSAPKEMAAAAVDKDAVFNEAAKKAIRWSLDEATKDQEWTLIDTPKIEVQESKDLGIKYKADLTIFPEVKLGNYKKIAKKVMAEKKEMKVEDKEIDQTLEWIRNSRKKDDKVPELNDEFAKSLGKFQSVDELKKNVADGLLMEKNFKEKDRLRLKMIDEIIKDSKIDAPEVMIEKTYQNIKQQMGAMMKAGGQKEEQIEEKLRERAKHNVQTNLLIHKIAQTEKLEPTAEEVQAKEGSVDGKENYQYAYGVVQNEKVFKFLESQQ